MDHDQTIQFILAKVPLRGPLAVTEETVSKFGKPEIFAGLCLENGFNVFRDFQNGYYNIMRIRNA